MSDALSFTELYGQHVELLPARTVLSMFIKADDTSSGGQGGTGSGDPVAQFLGSVMSGIGPKLS